MTATGERRHTVSHFHLDEPIPDIDVLVNSMTNVGENWDLDTTAQIGHLSSFISSSLFIPGATHTVYIYYERSL